MSAQQTTAAPRRAILPSGDSVPVLGQGTWGMGERPERRAEEIEAADPDEITVVKMQDGERLRARAAHQQVADRLRRPAA